MEVCPDENNQAKWNKAKFRHQMTSNTRSASQYVCIQCSTYPALKAQDYTGRHAAVHSAVIRAHTHAGRLQYANAQASAHNGVQSIEHCTGSKLAALQYGAVQCATCLLNVCEAMAAWVMFEADLRMSMACQAPIFSVRALRK